MRNMKGFTLIELVMVIVILGILAATALPRYADLQQQAREASRDGVVGAVRAAAAIAHASALVANQTGATGSITMEGNTVDLVFGYPAATTTGIGNAVDVQGVTVTGGTPFVWTIATGCTVTYTAATSATVPATVTFAATCS